MRVISHLIKKAKGLYLAIWCKHYAVSESSCPFTGKTYTVCNACENIVAARDTNG